MIQDEKALSARLSGGSRHPPCAATAPEAGTAGSPSPRAASTPAAAAPPEPVARLIAAGVADTGKRDGDPLGIASGPVFEDPELRSLKSRALAYLRLGIPVHFRGRAGMGKTTLALHLAAELGRPVTLLTGDHALSSADLIGREVGQDTRRVHDRYVQRVTRSEVQTRAIWADGALTRALEGGHTLVYDEFTRTPPETNNLLLSALEERVLAFATPLREHRLLRAHPGFRAIFTSNPDDYAGVSTAPDALFDRMITFDLSWVRPETELGIVACRTGLDPADAATVVALLRRLHASIPGENPPSVRTALMIGRVMVALGLQATAHDERFVQVCLDVLETRAPRNRDAGERADYVANLRRQILAACVPARPATETAP